MGFNFLDGETDVSEKKPDEKQFMFQFSINFCEEDDQGLQFVSRTMGFNFLDGETDMFEKKLDEKRFMFPNFVDPNGALVEELDHHAGCYKIEHYYAARMFYFFFESRGRKTDPVVIWLTGIRKDFSLVWNEYGWDQAYIEAAEIMLKDDVASNKAIGSYGSSFIQNQKKDLNSL